MWIKASAKRIFWLAAQLSILRPALIALYAYKSLDQSSTREHPYDRAHGVRTSGIVPGFVLKPGDSMEVYATAYIAAQPSILRRALAVIPDPHHSCFLDLGCGKGRPLLIATEFNFLTITGVEFSPTLSRIARRNAAIFAHAHPDRSRIDVVTGDALAYKLPKEKLVIFLYNPFDRPLMAQLLSNIEISLHATPRDLYIVYYNPTWAGVLDASTTLERRYAAQLPYDPTEVGYGPDTTDAVVIWQNRGNPHRPPPGNPDAPVVIAAPGMRAEIAFQT
jgi:SAM-dependent methyltransferase